MTTLSRKELQRPLADVDYPAGKDDLLATAERNDAGDDVLRALRGLPPVDYRNFDEVVASVNADVGPT